MRHKIFMLHLHVITAKFVTLKLYFTFDYVVIAQAAQCNQRLNILEVETDLPASTRPSL